MHAVILYGFDFKLSQTQIYKKWIKQHPNAKQTKYDWICSKSSYGLVRYKQSTNKAGQE